MKTRWNAIVPALKEFQSFLAENICPLEIQEAVDLANPPIPFQRIPELYQPGVYLGFDRSEKLFWVGKSTRSMRNRMSSLRKKQEFRANPGGWIDVIPFSIEFFFFAPALEDFLIARCDPRLNVGNSLVAIEYMFGRGRLLRQHRKACLPENPPT
jgi:hypothetical protein